MGSTWCKDYVYDARHGSKRNSRRPSYARRVGKKMQKTKEAQIEHVGGKETKEIQMKHDEGKENSDKVWQYLELSASRALDRTIHLDRLKTIIEKARIEFGFDSENDVCIMMTQEEWDGIMDVFNSDNKIVEQYMDETLEFKNFMGKQ